MLVHAPNRTFFLLDWFIGTFSLSFQLQGFFLLQSPGTHVGELYRNSNVHPQAVRQQWGSQASPSHSVKPRDLEAHFLNSEHVFVNDRLGPMHPLEWWSEALASFPTTWATTLDQESSTWHQVPHHLTSQDTGLLYSSFRDKWACQKSVKTNIISTTWFQPHCKHVCYFSRT